MTLDDLQKICDSATMAPWTNRMQDGICNKYIDEGIVISKDERDNMRPEDVAFIVAARGCLPKLIAVARAAEDAVGATLLHDWKPLEAALAALDSL